jgi:hypothetical protein
VAERIVTKDSIDASDGMSLLWVRRMKFLAKLFVVYRGQGGLLRDRAVKREAVMCGGYLFSDRTERILCGSSFRMNSGTSGSSIWASHSVLVMAGYGVVDNWLFC